MNNEFREILENKKNISDLDRNLEMKKFFISGDCINKGNFEALEDVTLYDVIYKFGGGITEGRMLKAIQIGGDSSEYLKLEQIDLHSIQPFKGKIQKGVVSILVIDNSNNMVDIVLDVAKSFCAKSCGKCTPCREGTLRIAELIEKISSGQGNERDIKQLEFLTKYMYMSSFCLIGQKAIIAIKSAMSLFPEDFSIKIMNEV